MERQSAVVIGRFDGTRRIGTGERAAGNLRVGIVRAVVNVQFVVVFVGFKRIKDHLNCGTSIFGIKGHGQIFTGAVIGILPAAIVKIAVGDVKRTVLHQKDGNSADVHVKGIRMAVRTGSFAEIKMCQFAVGSIGRSRYRKRTQNGIADRYIARIERRVLDGDVAVVAGQLSRGRRCRVVTVVNGRDDKRDRFTRIQSLVVITTFGVVDGQFAVGQIGRIDGKTQIGCPGFTAGIGKCDRARHGMLVGYAVNRLNQKGFGPGHNIIDFHGSVVKNRINNLRVRIIGR